ncbi:MAG: hypothetical protein RSD41_04540 [Kiritimatiellia bacterium]
MDMQSLLALQDEDGRLRDLQREIKVILPRRKADAQARLQSAREAVESAQQINLSAQREYARFQRDYTRQRDIMTRSERNSASLTNSRAVGVAMSEHATATAAAEQAQAAAAAVAEALTPEERRLDQARAFEAEEEVAVQELFNAITERKTLIETEIAKVQVKRDELAQAVPEDQLKYYDRLRLTRWPCIVEYNRTESVCNGCNLVQPHSVTQGILFADQSPTSAMVICPACGRILI